VINDTTEINFGCDRDLFGVGRVGSNQGRGFFLHTAMIVGAESEELVGLAAQELYLRPLKKVKRVTSAKRKKKLKRETDVWGRVIDRVGHAPDRARFIHVCDRGADNFDVFCHLLEQQGG
jgi:flagellar biosynthesis/type III secretory pathway ATPase